MSLHHHGPHMRHFLKNKEMNEMYASYGMFSFALDLISVFIPIYLYKLGYSIPAVIGFYFLMSLSFVAFSYLGARIVSRVGVKHSMLLASPFAIIFFIGLRFIGDYPFLFLLLPTVQAFKMLLFNYSFHLNFIHHSDKSNRGKEVSMLQASAQAASMLSPFVGGIIIKFAGFSPLFVIGSVLLMLATIPLFLTKETYEPISFDKKHLLLDIFKKKNLSLVYSFSGYAIESWIGVIIWPIFLFIMMFNIESIGAITSLTTFLTFLTFYYIGKATDKKDKQRLLSLGTFLYFFGWIGRIFVSGFVSVLFVDTYKNITLHLLHIPWTAYSYDIAAKRNYFKFIVQREVIFNLSRVIVLPLLMLLFSFNFYAFIISFATAAFASLLYVALNRELALEKQKSLPQMGD